MVFKPSALPRLFFTSRDSPNIPYSPKFVVIDVCSVWFVDRLGRTKKKRNFQRSKRSGNVVSFGVLDHVAFAFSGI